MSKVLIILAIVLGLVGIFFFLFNTDFGFLRLLQQIELLNLQVSYTRILPRQTVSLVKGMYLPSALFPHAHTLADPARLKEVGVNLVGLPVEYKVDKDGNEVKYFGEKFGGLDRRVSQTIRKYKEAGFAVFLTIKIRYLPKGRWGEPLGIPEELQSSSKFFQGFNNFVLRWADVAEKEKVEFFAPIDEGDYMMGPWRAAEWAQEILPKVKERFKGRVVYKGGFSPPAQISWFNFTGYDIAGATIVVLEEYNEGDYRQMARKQIADLVEVAQKRDKVSEVWISGFGVVETIKNPIDDTQKADIYRIVFEEASGKVTGLIPWENPPNPLKDTLMEKVIKEWFTKKIK